MKSMKISLIAVVALLFGGAVFEASAALAIIAHPSNKLSGISAEDAAHLFLGKTGEFSNGQRATPVHQAGNAPSRAKFLKGVLKKDEDELTAYWSKLQFSGKGQPPRELADDAAVKAFVVGNPDAIGYVDGKFVDGSVKVLLIVP